MTLDLAVRNLQAWHTVPCDYAPCSQPVGRRCVTTSGARTIPHAARLRALDWWLAGAASRDAEVDNLQLTVDQRGRLLTDADDAVRTITTERDDLKTSLAAANTEITGLNDQVTALTKDLAVTKAEYATYVKTHPDAPVPPTPTDPPGWKPLVSDDFSNGLDLKVWDVKDGWAMGGRDDVSMAKNVSIVDGRLRLWMRKEAAKATTGETRQITTGTVWLKQKLPAEYRLEYVLANLPQENGCWAGTCWATGSKSGAEIDSCESFPANKGFAKVTLHSRSYSGTGVNAHIMGGVTKALPPVPIKVVEEHRLTGVKVWWNDTLVASYVPGSTGWDAAYWEDAAQVWQLWINLQSGGFGGKVDATTDWAKTYMDVESVRVWVPA